MNDLQHNTLYTPPHIAAPNPPEPASVIIRTTREEYRINADGFIARACMGWQYSQGWRALNLIRYDKRGNVAESIPLCRWRELKAEFDSSRVFGGGKLRWFLMDRDCGAVRIWGSPVAGLYFPQN